MPQDVFHATLCRHNGWQGPSKEGLRGSIALPAFQSDNTQMESNMLYPILYWRHADWAKAFYKSVLPQLPALSRKELNNAALKLIMPFLLRRKGVHSISSLNQEEGMALSMDLTEEFKGLLAWGEWVHAGRQVIQVASPLAQELAASKTGELVLRDVLDVDGPKQAWYVHFNLPEDAIGRIDGVTPVEGAYVLLTPGHSVRLVLVGRGRSGQGEDALPCNGRYDLRLMANAFDLPVDEAVDAALAEDMQDLERARHARGVREPESVNVMIDKLRDRMLSNRDVYQKAVAFLINALAYRKWVAQPSRPKWTDDAPQSVVAQFKSASKRQADIIEDKLWNQGYTRVSMLGDEFVSAVAQGVNMHLRDGHWRNQAHGPQMSLRKLIWIRPTVVGHPSGASPATGA